MKQSLRLGAEQQPEARVRVRVGVRCCSDELITSTEVIIDELVGFKTFTLE